MMENINTHSPISTSYCQQNINIGPLKKFIINYNLIVNNDTKFFIYPLSSLKISIINLVFTNLNLNFFWIWEILEKYIFLLNYKFL